MAIFKGEDWEKVSERRARELAKKNGLPEGFWELFLFEANQSMFAELKEEK